jgi:hypothetical protein
VVLLTRLCSVKYINNEDNIDARVLALVCIRAYKRSREGTGSQVSGGEVLCECVSV